MSLNVIANIRSKPGKEKDVELLLTSLAKETHKEPGCQTYVVTQSAENKQQFFVVEKWASQKDLDLHFSTPHIIQALKVKDQLIDHFEVISLNPLRAGHPTKESY